MSLQTTRVQTAEQNPVRFALYENIPPAPAHGPGVASARARSREQATDLLAAGDGTLVAEFADHCPTRTEWKRRPGARAILGHIALPAAERDFDAVLIPDPATAFYRSQLSHVPAIFEHHGVALWTPTTAGPLDHASALHMRLLSNLVYTPTTGLCPNCLL
jgi:hypothetical protein